MEDVSFKMMGHWGHLDMYKWSYGKNSPVNLSSFEPMLSYAASAKLQIKWTFRILYKSMLSVIPETWITQMRPNIMK